MNERIRELAVETGWSEDIRYAPRAKEIEKFAELIIKDCISQIAIIGISNDENEDISWAVDLAILNIKDRFGIES